MGASLGLHSVLAEALVLEGIYHYSLLQGSTSPRYVTSAEFRVTRDPACNWLIEYRESLRGGTNAPTLIERTSAGCDGSQIYVLQVHREEVVKTTWGNRFESMRDQLPVGTAEILPGNYPAPNDAILQHLWMAYAFDCALPPPKGVAKPPFVTDLAAFFHPENVCEYRWFAAKGERAARRFELLGNGTQLERDRTTGELSPFTLPSPYDRGYRMGEGVWLAEGKSGSFVFPSEFRFAAFSPRPDGVRADQVFTAYEYTCRITNTTSSDLETVLPRLSGGAVFVRDRRLSQTGAGSLSYAISNEWLTASDDRLLRLLERSPKVSLEQESRQEHFGQPPSGRGSAGTRVMRVVFSLLLAAPLFGWVFYRLSKRTRS
jgi:hypothetical protein